MSGGFRVGRASSIALKEIRHILRDPFTLALALGLPVIFVGFFGYVIDFDVMNIRVAYQDGDQTRVSRQLAEAFEGSSYFDIREIPPSVHPLKVLDAEKARAVMIVEPQFRRDLESRPPAKVQVVLDGADNSTTGVIIAYLNGLQQAVHKRLTGRTLVEPIRVVTRFLFNPELNSRWFTVPGLAVIVMGMICILLTALTVAREWELGSMELLLSTPVRPLEIVVGKLLPYVGLGLASLAILYVMARAVFGVPFAGSHLLFGVATLLFLAATLAQGLLISVTTRHMQLAMQISIISGLLPNMLLSGFIFAIENMPLPFRILTSLLPPKWYMMICRGIFLKGAGPLELWLPFASLAAISSVLIMLAVRKFKTDLEP